MSYWNDLAGVAKGVSLVGRAYLREQSRLLDKRWQTASGRECLDAAVRRVTELANATSDPGVVKGGIKETVERAQTFAEGLRQGASIVLDRSKGGESLPDDTSPETAFATSPLERQEKPPKGTQLENDTGTDMARESRTYQSSSSTGFPPNQKIDDFVISPTSRSRTAAMIDQKLSETSRERRVPSSRIARAASFANLAVGLAAGAVTELTKKSLGLSQKEGGMGLLDSNPILSEANAERIVNTLCRVRGAALKLGQMLSIQDNSMISPQIQQIFERVRFSADFMPTRQVEKAMKAELGDDWRSKLASFNDRPFAAASIGQVHKATLKSGMEVAVKIQYPGVAKSIDSDINNLVTVLTIGNILPRGMYLESFVRVAKSELAQECDYLREAQSMKRFKNLLAKDTAYYIPDVVDEFSTQRILCTELIHGLPVDKCVDLDQDTRNWIATKLLDLCLRELFEFNFMQTDPNWSNFFYNMERRQVLLVDFGASREFGTSFVDKYMKIIKAAAAKDTEKILQYSREIGFLVGYETKIMENAHCDAVSILGEPFGDDAEFDFGNQNTTARVQRLIPVMLEHRLTPPPEEAYSLHRKLSGTFLLCAKLKAKIRCKPLFDRACDRFSSATN